MELSIFLLIVMLAGVAGGAEIADCPVADPCKCYEGKHNTSLIACNQKNLDSNSLPAISQSSLENVVLIFSLNKITEIPNDYFNAFCDSAVGLRLQNNKLKAVPEALSCLKSLEYLILSENLMSHIKESSFSALESLQYLDLRGNLIEDIDKDSFAGLKNLEQLNLESNKISAVAEGAFQHLSAAFKLKLKNNRLKDVSKNILGYMPKLKTLYVNQNKFQEVPQKYFENLPSLKNVFLGENKITNVTVSNTQYFGGLQFLCFRDNDISYMEEGALDSAVELQQLVLAQNKLSEIPLIFTQEHPKFAWVRLDRMKDLKQFPDGFFHAMPNLEYLNLAELPLSNLPNITGLSKLTELSIMGTKIQKIYPCQLDGVDSLYFLFWSNVICDCDSVWLKHWKNHYGFNGTDHRLPNNYLRWYRYMSNWKCAETQKSNRGVIARGKGTGTPFNDISVKRMTCKDRDEGSWCYADSPRVPPVIQAKSSSVTKTKIKLSINLTNTDNVSIKVVQVSYEEMTKSKTPKKSKTTDDSAEKSNDKKEEEDTKKTLSVDHTRPILNREVTINSLRPDTKYKVCAAVYGTFDFKIDSKCFDVTTMNK